MRGLANIFWLSIKELRSLRHDRFLMFFVIYSFSLAVYSSATGISFDLRNAAIAIADEDQSVLSRRIADAFLAPQFQRPTMISVAAIDSGMDSARFTFVIDIPPGFEADLQAGRHPALQVNVDATAMMLAGIGAGYIQSILTDEIARHLGGDAAVAPRVELVALQQRMAFNQTLDSPRFGGVMAIINNVTMLAVLLSGAALIREREHGTIDHLLAMPLTPMQIMAAKILATGAVILVAVVLSLVLILRGVLGLSITGSLPLFVAGVAVYLFFATSLGIFLGTIVRSMPQLGLLFILIVLPMNMLSGGNTPLESMPPFLRYGMQLVPSTHFVSFAQAILFRGAGIEIVWPSFAATAGIGTLFAAFSAWRFRRMLLG
ncbi:MAG: ABC transporter permease [Alphaproteobacteria bacterium]|nr:MAG: ABC transporter permease [Alphaproteobacteria bacterium]